MIKVICVGRIKEKYLTEAINEYKKRLSKYTKLDIIEVSDIDNPSIDIILSKERDLINKYIGDKDYVITTFNHFYGNRSSNLYNQMQLECKDVKDKTNMYLNTELVVDRYPVKDDKGNVIANLPIAVASGNVHVTQDGGTMNSILNQLPEDLLQHGNITVRSYPWRGQAEVCWYGHMVETTVTPEKAMNCLTAAEIMHGYLGRRIRM